MSISFPGESPEYRTARNRLLQQEVELRRVTEAVAAARRALPPGGIVPQDYIFQHAGPEGTPTNVRFSELFERGNDTLVVYNFMFPRVRHAPPFSMPLTGPRCTSASASISWSSPRRSFRASLPTRECAAGGVPR